MHNTKPQDTALHSAPQLVTLRILLLQLLHYSHLAFRENVQVQIENRNRDHCETKICPSRHMVVEAKGAISNYEDLF